VSATRIVLADDHRIVLEGLAQLFSLEADVDIVARCIDGVEAQEAVERLDPDVLVADVRMPKMTGVELLQKLRERGSRTRVVLLTADIREDEVLTAVRLGVGGIILKEAAPRALVQCVRAVASGKQWLDQRTVQSAVDKVLRRESALEKVRGVLTRREVEIVKMVATGLKNREIGEKLFISEGTVKIHLHTIYEKLGVSGRVELSNYARENAIL
jgi:DNA-binding NarL/FixJ family response regulator